MTTNADLSPHATSSPSMALRYWAYIGTLDGCSDNDWVCMAMYRIMEYMQLTCGCKNLYMWTRVLTKIYLPSNGSPHTLFLAPPVTACIRCASKLSAHKKPTAVICYTCTGPMPAVKITLRCDKCGTNYR